MEASQQHVHQHFTKEKQGQWNGPFCFVQGADTQLGLIERYLERKADPKWDKEIALTKAAVQIINSMKPKPKFFVVCGDLIDAYPDTENRAAQEKDLKAILSEVDPDIPLVCVCGNHDVGEVPTKKSVETYRASFGSDYFSFWVGGVKFLVVNSQFYMDRSKVEDIASGHDRWLMAELESNKTDAAQHVLVFQHIPWFLHDQNEEGDGYFNINREVRLQWLERFKHAGVRKIFCGHWHRNAGGWYDEAVECVVTSAIGAQLGQDKSGFRLVQVTEGDITHKYHNIEDYPEGQTLPTTQ